MFCKDLFDCILQILTDEFSDLIPLEIQNPVNTEIQVRRIELEKLSSKVRNF